MLLSVPSLVARKAVELVVEQLTTWFVSGCTRNSGACHWKAVAESHGVAGHSSLWCFFSKLESGRGTFRAGLSRPIILLIAFVISHAEGTLHILLEPGTSKATNTITHRLCWTGLDLWDTIVKKCVVLSAVLHVAVETNIVLTYDPGRSYETCDIPLRLARLSLGRELQRLRILTRSSVLDRVWSPPANMVETLLLNAVLTDDTGRSSKTCDTPLHLCEYPLDSVSSTILTLSRKMHFSEECLARVWTVTEPPNTRPAV